MTVGTPSLAVDLREIQKRLHKLETAPKLSIKPDDALDFTSVRLQGIDTELRCLQAGSTTVYVPIRASSFPTSSSREVKEGIADIDFDTVEAIKAAPAQTWRYKASFADEGLTHVGPMAEDLPDVLVHDSDGVPSVDLLSLVGTLWDAVARLTERIEALEARP